MGIGFHNAHSLSRPSPAELGTLVAPERVPPSSERQSLQLGITALIEKLNRPQEQQGETDLSQSEKEIGLFEKSAEIVTRITNFLQGLQSTMTNLQLQCLEFASDPSPTPFATAAKLLKEIIEVNERLLSSLHEYQKECVLNGVVLNPGLLTFEYNLCTTDHHLAATARDLSKLLAHLSPLISDPTADGSKSIDAYVNAKQTAADISYLLGGRITGWSGSETSLSFCGIKDIIYNWKHILKETEEHLERKRSGEFRGV